MAEGKDSKRSENKAKDEKRWFNFIYSIVIPVVKLIYPVRCKGTENIPEGPAVVCGNHSNLVDPLLAAAAFGKRTFMHFIAKVELSTVPVVGAQEMRRLFRKPGRKRHRGNAQHDALSQTGRQDIHIPRGYPCR